MAKKLRLATVFGALQQQMEAKLSMNRKVLLHPTDKGDASELEWVEMLSAYLPKRYAVNKAHVVDHGGNTSEQIDIVIFDQHYSPFVLKQNGINYIPAESVYAVLEVKPTLSRANLEYASKKAKSVRRLKRTSALIVQADRQRDIRGIPPRILAGIVGINGQISEVSKNYLRRLPESAILNLGCALEGTYFKLGHLDPFKSVAGPYDLKVVSGSKSLIQFFVNLLAELQKMGTVPAIELEQYIKEI